MEERGLTQEALAEKAERSVDGISALERGLVLPGFETLERLASVLKVPLATFFVDAEDDSRERAALRARLIAIAEELPDDLLGVAVDQIAMLGRVSEKGTAGK